MTSILSKLDQSNPDDPNGNEEIATLLSALEKSGRRVRVASATGKVARIFIYADNRESANADRGNKIP